jgi:hypothetical protein
MQALGHASRYLRTLVDPCGQRAGQKVAGQGEQAEKGDQDNGRTRCIRDVASTKEVHSGNENEREQERRTREMKKSRATYKTAKVAIKNNPARKRVFQERAKVERGRTGSSPSRTALCFGRNLNSPIRPPSEALFHLPRLWIAGKDVSGINAPGGVELIDDGAWHPYEIDITALVQQAGLTNVQLMLEGWNESLGVPGDAYFDNIELVARGEEFRLEDFVPCAGPLSGGVWKNHGQYVSTVAKMTRELARHGVIAGAERATFVRDAAQSNCGKKVKNRNSRPRVSTVLPFSDSNNTRVN